MGRHAADDAADVHPLVAAALARRAGASEPTAPAGDGVQPADGIQPADGVQADSAAPAVVVLDDGPSRRGRWRRLFGGSAGPDADPAGPPSGRGASIA